YARTLAGLGRLDDLVVLFLQHGKRQIVDPDASTIWERTMEATVRMERSPEIAYKCGVYALANVGHALTGKDYKPIAAIGSPFEGFSLASLETVARQQGLPLRAAARTMGDVIPVPAVVHWAQNHYAAIVNQQGDYFTVVDPTFGGVQYLTADAINEEASGYFLVRSDALLPGYAWLVDTDSSKIHGKGYADVADDDDPDGCTGDCCANSGSGADGTGGGCDGSDPAAGSVPPDGGDAGRPEGMAAWKVIEPSMNLRISDIPLSYTPAFGPSFVLRINMQQRMQMAWVGSRGRSSHFGPNVGSSLVNFICGVNDNPLPALILTDLGEVEVALWTGGGEHHHLFFNAGATDSQVEPLSGVWARRLLDGNNSLVAIEVYYRNGSKERYERDPTSWIMNLKVRTDSTGNSLTYAYTQTTVNYDDGNESVNRLDTVTTADGKVFTFAYDFASNIKYTMLVTGVSGPDGRAVGFGYTYDAFSNTRYLSSITDVVGLTSSFAGNTTSPFWITQLTTPYGDTFFQHYSVGGCFINGNLSCTGVDRSIVITEPDGSQQVYLFYDEPLDVSQGIPAAFVGGQIPDFSSGDAPPALTTDTIRNKRNSHHWNRQQSAGLSAHPIDPLAFVAADFRISTTKHWLIHWMGTGIPGTMAPVLSWVLPPAADGTTEGLPLFYDYVGKDPTHQDTIHNVPPSAYMGSSPLPTLLSQRRPDGTSWYLYTPRNSAGMRMSQKERWEEDGAVKSRTSTYTYASGTGDPTVDGLLLVEAKGPYGELVHGYKLHPTYQGLYLEETNALGEVTAFTYNAQKQVATRLTAAGLLSTFTYDGANQLQQIVDTVAGTPVRTNSYTWLNGFKRTETDPRGLTKTFDFDFLGRPTQITYSSDATTEQFFYSLPASTGFNTSSSPLPLLDPVYRKDRLGYFWYTIPNRLRQTEKVIEPSRGVGQAGVEHTFVYCGCGSPTSITRASNKAEAETTGYVYDYRGNPTTVNLPDSVTVTREYDLLGRLYREIDSYSLTTNRYDNLGRLREVRNGKGLVDARGYDLQNRQVAVTNSSGIWSTNLFDNLGRVTIRGYADSTSGTADGKELWGYTVLPQLKT
ncbi:MAG TPA: hypothetical protein DCM86_14135, partial [Verrucomicrobiales bacterium]|nr:hypothetical protein [Verrucomicrobiales bacterium]